MNSVGRERRVVASGGVAAVVAVLAGLLLALAGRYGYHRDELYFIACGRHLAWGYPDQGPVTPVVAHVMDTLAPGSVAVLRVPAMLCVLATVVLAALLARELGGAGFAQVLTAVVVGTGVVALLGGHLLSTATIDLLVWTLLIYLVVRILAAPAGARDRLWLVVGAVGGVGLLNKALPTVLLLGLLVGGLLTPATRRRLRSPWPAAGAIVALALWAPYLLWQARNGWPQVELGRLIADEYGTAGNRVAFVVQQVLLFGFAGAFLWIYGVTRSLRIRPGRPAWQPVLGWAWLVIVVVFVLTAGQGYYGAGIYPSLIAAGAVGVEARLRSRRARALTVAGALALSAALAPAALPLLPARTLQSSGWAGAGDVQFDTVGWPRLVADLATTYRSLPPADRARAVLLADNYGEAGAMDELGGAWGLPPAYSGLNAYGWWGPPPDTGRVGKADVISVSEDGPPSLLPACRLVRPVRNDEGVRNEETTRAAIYLCDPPLHGWASIWPRLRHLSN